MYSSRITAQVIETSSSHTLSPMSELQLFSEMTSAQTKDTSTLADRVVVLEEYIKKRKISIRNKQTAMAHLTEVNKQLADVNVLLTNSQDLLIRTHDIAIISAHN